jgi:hypothetical protein
MVFLCFWRPGQLLAVPVHVAENLHQPAAGVRRYADLAAERLGQGCQRMETALAGDVFVSPLPWGQHFFSMFESPTQDFRRLHTAADDESLPVEGLWGHLDDRWRHGLKPCDDEVQ